MQALTTATNHLERASVSAEVQTKTKTGFLRPLDEMIMLAIPSIGIILCVLSQMYTKFMHGTVGVDDVATLLTTLIFMDGVHVTFTFMLIAFLPELRNWSTSSENKPAKGWDKGFSFWKRMIIIASSLALVVFVLKVSPTSATVRGFATIWLFLELLGPSQHTAAQMRGISFVYNSTIRRAYSFTKKEQEQAISAEKAERHLFKNLIVGDVLYWIPKIFQPDQIHVPYIGLVQYVGGIMVGGAAIGLLLNSFRYPKQEETDKTLFLTRVLLFPFKILTPVGGLAIRAAHGSEYLLIFRKMVQGSSISEKKQKRVYLYTAIVSVLYGLVFLLIWPTVWGKGLGMIPGRNLVGIALLVTFVVRFTHYYMDALVFKMSDPMTRMAVGPLLAPEKAK